MSKVSKLFQAISGVFSQRHAAITATHKPERQRRKAVLSLALWLILALSTAAIAFAVHNDSFELDGNAVDDPAGPPDDWQNIYQGNSNANADTGIVHDGHNPPEDSTYFTGGGSKDVNDIDQWRFTNNDQAPDKDELTNIYAATYKDDGETTLYFGADRYASKGNSQIGFWLFQNPVSLGADGRFNGTHRVGDLLVVSDFVKGGKIPEIKVYEWVGSGGSDGPLNRIFKGNDCFDDDHQRRSQGNDHSDDESVKICATVNQDKTAAPWPYKPKDGKDGTFPPGSFYEGMVNLTSLGLSDDTCFASFLAETRSSTSLDATLKDFSLGALDVCATAPQGEASLAIEPAAAAARAGESQTFTVTATQFPDGVTPQPAAGVLVTASLQNNAGATADFVGGVNTCTTDGSGVCTLSLTSPTTGDTTLNVSADIPVNDTSFTRSAVANARWVDARLALTVSGGGVNVVGTPIDLSAQLDFDYGDGQSWVGSPAGQVISLTVTLSGTTETLTCVTGDSGACAISYSADAPGLVTINGEWQGVIGIAPGVQAAAQAQSFPVEVRWVGAQLALSPEIAANQLGSTHQLTAQLHYDDGLGLMPLPGQTINFEIASGPGAPSGDSSCITGAGGDCAFNFSSVVTGTSVVSATWSGDIMIDGIGSVPASASDAAEKVWVDVRLNLQPAVAAGVIDQPQTIIAAVEVDAGGGFVAPISATGPVSVTLVNGPGGFSGPPCDFGGGLSCQITLVSSDPGLSELSAAWSGAVEVLPGVMAQASAGPVSAAHRWVEAVLSLSPETADGFIGQPHALTATLQFDTGSGPQPATLEKTQDITFTLGGVGSLSAPNCIEAGTCQLTLESTTPGTSTITATWSGTVDTGEGIVPVTLADVATKSWFDLRVSIGDEVGDTCTDAFDPNNSVADILDETGAPLANNQLASGDTVTSRLCDAEDFDFYWLDLQESSYVSVDLTGLQDDYDVVVYTALDENLASDPAEDAQTLVQVQNVADVDSLGRMSSGRMSSGRMSSGRMSSGRMSSGRMSSGRMSSGSAQAGVVDEHVFTFVEGPQRLFIAVYSGVGASGSEYTLHVETESGDQGANTCTSNLPAPTLPAQVYDGSGGQPLSLILTSQRRLEGFYGAASTQAVMSRLQELANDSAVRGLIVPVETDGAVASAYSQWDADYCSIDRANQVAVQIKQLIDFYTGQYPTLQYIVIAGSHEIIPFRQVPDFVQISPESDYTRASTIGQDNPLYWSLNNSWVSTDDFYADDTPLLLRGHELYLPDRAIGRLVETPAEMITVIDNFFNSSQQSNIATCMITGYEFLTDGAAAIEDTLQQFAVIPDTLNNDTWTAADLRNVWSNGPDLISINAHFEHYRLQPANLQEQFFSGDVPGNAANAVGYSVGCHSGLNVPDGAVAAAEVKLDFPQVFAQRGAAAWVANTGYGYGDDQAIADSELLMLYFTEELGRQGAAEGVATGQALIEAKYRFIGSFSEESFGQYEEKSMIEATLYGLPMHRVVVPAPQVNLNPAVTPLNKVAGLASLDPTSTLVNRSQPAAPSRSLSSDVSTLTFSLTREDTPRGSFFTTGGRADVQVVAGQPLQPKEIIAVPAVSGRPARGALLLSARFSDLTDFDPVVSIPMSDTTLLEPQFGANGWYPAKPWVINRFGRDPRLVVVPGQYRAEGRIQRVYDDMTLETYYSDDQLDFQPPGIWSVSSVCGETDMVEFAAKIEDAAGIVKALVTTNDQAGRWQSAELTVGPHPDGDGSLLASGSVALPPGIDYFVQAADSAGNVTVEANKGLYYQTCVSPANADNNLISDSDHPIVARFEIDRGVGWLPLPNASVSGDFVTVDGGQIINNTCQFITDSNGECEVRISTDATGVTTVVINPIITVNIGGEVLEIEANVKAGAGTFVKEWWAGSVSVFKGIEPSPTSGHDDDDDDDHHSRYNDDSDTYSKSVKVCFSLAKAGGNGYAPVEQCFTFDKYTRQHLFSWAGLPTGEYILTETSVSAPYLPMSPNPLTGIGVNSANRNVVLGTLVNQPEQQPPPPAEGCSPAEWQKHWFKWSQHPYAKFSDVFGVKVPGQSKYLKLYEAIKLRGENTNKLARHGVAALLNAESRHVNYPYSPQQVIDMVRAGMGSNGEPQATQLAAANELGCPLN